MDILQEVQTFINSKDFWIYHGFVLSGMWVFLSALAILLKKVNTQLHVLLFILIDAITVFFAGAALWRVSASFHLFNEWPLLKKAHVCAGSSISLFRFALFSARYCPAYRRHDCFLRKEVQSPTQKLWQNFGHHRSNYCRSRMASRRESKICDYCSCRFINHVRPFLGDRH